MLVDVTPLTVGNVWLLLRKFRYDSLIDAAVHGYHGIIKTDDLMKPNVVYINVGDTVYLAGDETHEAAKEVLELLQDGTELICSSAWIELIKRSLNINISERTRCVFDHKALKLETMELMIASLEDGYYLESIDESTYYELLRLPWASSFVSNFKDYSQFATLGKGFVVRHDDEIVSGASSYIHYNEGKEVEICTHKDYRRKGLAKACGAAFIKACILDNEIPHWDAANTASQHLAETLGYRLKDTYTVYDLGFDQS